MFDFPRLKAPARPPAAAAPAGDLPPVFAHMQPQAVQVPIQQLQVFDLNAAETASRAQVGLEARAEFDRAAAEAASESAAFSTPSNKVHPS